MKTCNERLNVLNVSEGPVAQSLLHQLGQGEHQIRPDGPVRTSRSASWFGAPLCRQKAGL